MKNITVEISPEESLLVERAFFEYNALNNILAFLSSQETCQQKYLDKYFQDAVEKNVELELLKTEITNKYRPVAKNQMMNYAFDFETNSIIFGVNE